MRELYPDAARALADMQLVLATTARGRDVVRDILTPRKRRGGCARHRKRGIQTAILFGGERAGLDNDEISLCDALITIPTAPAAGQEIELKAGPQSGPGGAAAGL